MRTFASACAWILIAVATAGCRSISTPPASGTGTVGAGDGGQPGSGGGGQPDGGAGGEGGDECAGLGPDTVGPPSATVTIRASASENWFAGANDGSGTLALMMTNDNYKPSLRVRLFDPSGAQRGTYQPAQVTLSEQIFGQLDGFTVSYYDTVHDSHELVALDRNASVIAATGTSSRVVWPVADPLGGIVVLGRVNDTYPIEVAAYDERLNQRFRTQLSSIERVLASGVDLEGNTLVLLDAKDRYGAGKLGGIWIDHSGNAGAEFLALENIPSPPYVFLTPRVGSGFFVGTNPGPPTAAAWIGQFDAMGGRTAPPEWLAARPVETLRLARKRRAYAVISPARLDNACHVDVEVVAPSGKSCGTATFPAAQSGQFCSSGLFVGYDGTAVVGSVEDTGGGFRTFTFRWWTAFLR